MKMQYLLRRTVNCAAWRTLFLLFCVMSLGMRSHGQSSQDRREFPANLDCGDQVSAVVWSLDDRIVYCGCGSKIVRWDPWRTTHSPVNTEGHSGNVRSLEISLDGSILASAGWDGFARNWQLDGDGSLAHNAYYSLNSKYGEAVAINPTATMVAAGDCAGMVFVFEIASGLFKWGGKAHDKCVNAVAFDPSGRFVLSGGDDGKLKCFDVQSGKKLGEKGTGVGGITDMEFTQLGDRLFASGKNGKVAEVSFPKLEVLHEFQDHERSVNRLSLSHDGRFLLSAGSDTKIQVRDLKANRVVGTVTGVTGERLTALALSHDGRWLVYGGSGRILSFYNMLALEGYAAANLAACSLFTVVSFVDTATFDPNRILDGAESEGFIETTTRNAGQGPAFGVRLELTCDNADITLETTSRELGTMLPGAEETIRWPLRVSSEAKTGPASFLVATRERQMRDGVSVRLQASVAALKSPRFELVRDEWNDGMVGSARGNNNGVPENGERVVLSVFVRNNGIGRGRGVQVELTGLEESGAALLSGKAVSLTSMAPGETKSAEFVLELPKQFDQSALTYGLAVTDQRGVASLILSNQEKKVNVNRPILTVVVDAPPSVANGDSMVVLLSVRNDGTLQATDVAARPTSCPGVTFLDSQIRIGKIDPRATSPVHKAIAVVARDFVGAEVPIRIEVTQGDNFPKTETVTRTTVSSRKPDLQISLARADGITEKRFSFGDTLTLLLTVANKGELGAEGVAAVIEADRPNVHFENSMQQLGSIPAGVQLPPLLIPVSVDRTGTPGPARVSVRLTQTAFASISEEFHYEVSAASPALEVSIKRVDGQQSFTQGERSSVSLVIYNKGSLDAREVAVDCAVDRPDINFAMKPQSISRIPAGGASAELKMPLFVPAGAEAGPFVLTATARQADYPSVTSSFSFDVMARDAEVQVVVPEIPSPQIFSEEPAPAPAAGPTIVWSSERETDTVFNPTEVLSSLTIVSPAKIATLAYTVNGVKIFDQTDLEVQRSLRQSGQTLVTKTNIAMALRDGSNVVEVSVRDLANNISQKSMRIVYIPTRVASGYSDASMSDVDVHIGSHPEAPEEKNRYAIVIGIEKYLHAAEAPFARRDAKIFAEFAKRVLGVPDRNVIEVCDEQATASILKYVIEDLGRQLGGTAAQAEVYFYFSGHGVPDRTVGGSNAVAYLLPFDLRAGAELGVRGGISTRELYRQLRALGLRYFFVAIDACFSGTDRYGKSLDGARPVGYLETDRLDGSNEALLVATDFNQTAGPYKDKSHGLFTYFLLKGLTGSAADKDGNVTLRSLDDYLREIVPATAIRTLGTTQNPQVSTGDPDHILVNLKR